MTACNICVVKIYLKFVSEVQAGTIAMKHIVFANLKKEILKILALPKRIDTNNIYMPDRIENPGN